MLEDQLRLQGQTHSGFSSSLPTFIAKINRCIPGGVKVGANSRAHNVSGLASSLSREIIEPRICHNFVAQLLVLLGAARWRGLDIPMSKLAGSLVPGPVSYTHLTLPTIYSV